MSREADRLVARFSERHHGVFTLAHTVMLGVSAKERAHRLSTGQWGVLHDDVYWIAGVPLTWKGKLLAACWAGGFRAAASHRSAAALYELAGGRRPIPEIVCPRWRRARHDGIVVHETTALDAADLTEIDGIPVTTPARTLLDLGAVCSPSVVEMALDAAERRDLVTLDSAKAALHRLGRRGRRGAGVLRELLERSSPKKAPRESEQETRLFQVLRRHGLPEPVPQYIIRRHGRFVAKVDAAYPQWRIAIEYDSYEHHAGRKAHERDTARRLRISSAQWHPLAATGSDLRGGGRVLCQAIDAIRSGAD